MGRLTTCMCPCGCKYALLNGLSQEAGLCFSCRKEVHAGRAKGVEMRPRTKKESPA